MVTNTTIVIVSFNSREITLRALAAAGEAAAGLDAVRVLADNGSTDGTPDAVRSTLPGVEVVVYADNPGYGAALNRAFSAFPGSHLCALNGDVLLAPGSLQTLRQFLDMHPKCGLVGPSLTNSDGRPQPSCKRVTTPGFAVAELFAVHRLFPQNRWIRWFYYKERDLTVPTFVQTVSGAAMLIRGEAFQRIGGFDEGFQMYFEETDLCRRLRGAGYEVAFCPQATAVHCHGTSTIQTSVRQVEYYLSYIRFFGKHYGAGPARILAAAVATSTALRMFALPLKYPPLFRRGRTILGPKFSACCRLLRDLPRSAALRAPMQVEP